MARLTDHEPWMDGGEAHEGLAIGEALVHGTLGHRVISFDYQGQRRTVEPHMVGMHEAGEAVLIAYQTGGTSNSGDVPGWRTFIIAEIDEVEIEDRVFAGPRPDFDTAAGRMVDIFARA